MAITATTSDLVNPLTSVFCFIGNYFENPLFLFKFLFRYAQRVTPLATAGDDNDNFALGLVFTEPGGDLFKGAAAVLLEFL